MSRLQQCVLLKSEPSDAISLHLAPLPIICTWKLSSRPTHTSVDISWKWSSLLSHPSTRKQYFGSKQSFCKTWECPFRFCAFYKCVSALSLYHSCCPGCYFVVCNNFLFVHMLTISFHFVLSLHNHQEAPEHAVEFRMFLNPDVRPYKLHSIMKFWRRQGLTLYSSITLSHRFTSSSVHAY